MTKTKFINEPHSKELRKALRFAGYDRLKSWKTNLIPLIQAGEDLPGASELSYISAGTYQGQTEGYLRYLLCSDSWEWCGKFSYRRQGPREEIRFYHSQGSQSAYKILFVYLDYTSGVMFDITHEEWAVDLFERFRSSGELEEHRQRALSGPKPF